MLKLYLQCKDKYTGKVGDFLGFEGTAHSPVFGDLCKLYKWASRYNITYKLNETKVNPFDEALIFLKWQGGTIHDVIKELTKRVDSCQFCDGNGVVDGMPCTHHEIEDYLLEELEKC